MRNRREIVLVNFIIYAKKHTEIGSKEMSTLSIYWFPKYVDVECYNRTRLPWSKLMPLRCIDLISKRLPYIYVKILSKLYAQAHTQMRWGQMHDSVVFLCDTLEAVLWRLTVMKWIWIQQVLWINNSAVNWFYYGNWSRNFSSDDCNERAVTKGNKQLNNWERVFEPFLRDKQNHSITSNGPRDICVRH